MGWTFTYSNLTKAEWRAEILRDCNWDNERTTGSVLVSRTVGNHLWLAMRTYDKEHHTAISFVQLFLLTKQDGRWGYKDMDESMGPYCYDCPQAVIDAAGPTNNETALKWRAKVAKYQTKKREQRHLLKQLQVGSVVELQGCKPSRFRVSSVKPFRGYAVDTGAGPYRLSKTRLMTVE